MSSSTVVSAPGKVLLAGGYLVLDPKYSGVVVSTSSRFYTVVSQEHDRGNPPIQIRVRSPQFVNASWTYRVHLGDSNIHLEQLVDGSDPQTLSKNKFVQLALERTLLLALEYQGVAHLRYTLKSLEITILGDNDFYSQRAQLTARNLPPTLRSLSQLLPFLHTGVVISDVHKTGLGSSAALITSLVSALLLHLNVIPSDSFDVPDPRLGGSATASPGKKLAHNLAQYVHCLAQGKVGSGFDVSAAAFGSQLYTRFDPSVIQPLMNDDHSMVLSPSNSEWSYRAEAFQLPPHVRLMLADVDAGSDTPSLVGKVLKWRKERPEEAQRLWDATDALNQQFGRTLLGLSDLALKYPKEYPKVIKYLSSLQSCQWLANPILPESEQRIIDSFHTVRQTAEEIRGKMREMGSASDVPIEPPEQTRLLNECVSLAGVIGGGVPGAGGYDAIWLLVFDPKDCPESELPSTRVEGIWSMYRELSVSPLLASETVAKGVRVENLDAIPGLQEIVNVRGQ